MPAIYFVFEKKIWNSRHDFCYLINFIRDFLHVLFHADIIKIFNLHYLLFNFCIHGKNGSKVITIIIKFENYNNPFPLEDFYICLHLGIEDITFCHMALWAFLSFIIPITFLSWRISQTVKVKNSKHRAQKMVLQKLVKITIARVNEEKNSHKRIFLFINDIN